jgi:hypothetical protein
VSVRLRHMGRDIQSRLKDFFENAPERDATPLELLHTALDQLERKVQPAGRGRRLFPYDRVVIRIAQSEADTVAVEAVFNDVAVRLRDRLAELKCDAPEFIDVSLSFVDPSTDSAVPVVSVECFSEPRQRATATRSIHPPTLTLTILKGQCAEAEYVLSEPVIAIGRTPEPTDAFGQVRYNHIAFLETRDGINETVGRAHARLQFDPSSGRYHLFNEASSNPTSIIRGGKSIRVAPRDPRGVAVQSGDQVQLGRAVLRVNVEEREGET